MDFCLKSAVLSTKPLLEVSHTAHNLSEALKAIFSEWEITEKITCIVSDNANNMISTCNLLQKRHMSCFAHSLNLVVQDCLSDVGGILKRVKSIVTYFKSSYEAMDTFKKEQNTKEPLKLMQEVPTRWNSSYYTIERVVKTNEALNRSLLQLRNAPVPLSLEELTVLEDILKVLSCFEEATKKIQGNTYVTISLVIPLTFGIYNSLISTLPELQTEEGKTFCNNLLQSVRTRLFPYETRSVARLGTILDPRFKKEGFRSAENAAYAVTLLGQEMISIMKKNEEKSKTQNASLNVAEISSEKPKQSSTLFGFLSDRVKLKEKPITADVIITKRQYLERPNSNTDVDPLLYWKVAGEDLKPMEQVARKFFCIPATSAESERVFSLTGQLIENRRSRLKPKNVDMMVFLNKNFKI